MTVSTLTLDPRKIDWQHQPGLYVTVHRSGLLSTTSGVSERCHLLTINGVITKVGQRPQLRPLRKEACSSEPGPEALPVWMYQNFDQVFLVPATILVNGLPDIAGWKFGGNFAYRSDPRFYELIGFDAAVKIHDHREA